MVTAADLTRGGKNVENVASHATIFERSLRTMLVNLAEKSAITAKLYMYIYFLIENKYQSSKVNRDWMSAIEALDSRVTAEAKELVETIRLEISKYVSPYSCELGEQISAKILKNLAQHAKENGKC